MDLDYDIHSEILNDGEVSHKIKYPLIDYLEPCQELLPMNSLSNQYFDPDHFLAEEELVFAKFNAVGYGVGRFLPEGSRLNVETNTQISVPFWIAEVCQELKEEDSTIYMEASLPNSLNDDLTSSILADPQDINLASINRNYYKFGAKVAKRLRISKNLDENLTTIFKKRLTKITDLATVRERRTTEISEFHNTLDNTENELYKAVLDSHNRDFAYELRKPFGYELELLRQ